MEKIKVFAFTWKPKLTRMKKVEVSLRCRLRVIYSPVQHLAAKVPLAWTQVCRKLELLHLLETQEISIAFWKLFLDVN